MTTTTKNDYHQVTTIDWNVSKSSSSSSFQKIHFQYEHIFSGLFATSILNYCCNRNSNPATNKQQQQKSISGIFLFKRIRGWGNLCTFCCHLCCCCISWIDLIRSNICKVNVNLNVVSFIIIWILDIFFDVDNNDYYRFVLVIWNMMMMKQFRNLNNNFIDHIYIEYNYHHRW